MTVHIHKKDWVARMMQASGILNLAGVFKKNQYTLPILAYHRVLEIAGDYPFDEGVISASTEVFDKQIGFIKKNFNALTFFDLKDALDGTISIPNRPLIITFDDGYADNVSNAFPILKRHGLSATFFITTDYIGTGHPFWWEKVAYWLKQRQFLKNVPEWLAPPFNEKDNLRRMPRWLNGLSDPVRLQFLALWEAEYPIARGEIDAIRPLTWDEVRSMSQAGMEIGSHTVTHPNLAQLEKRSLFEELIHSKQKIEKEIGKEVISIAYPTGKEANHNRLVYQATEEAGYLFGLTYEDGINSLRHLPKYQLKRIDVERMNSFALFQANLLFPRLFSYSWKKER